jgi:hypothetical protein
LIRLMASPLAMDWEQLWKMYVQHTDYSYNFHLLQTCKLDKSKKDSWIELLMVYQYS